MTNREPLAFLLGFEGFALHRAFAGEHDPAFADERIAEVRAMLAAYDRGALGPGDAVGELGTVEGYRVWARTYDEPGNPLLAVDEPIVAAMLGAQRAGDALDAACGTGRFAAMLAAAIFP